jgi:hypothetical protein
LGDWIYERALADRLASMSAMTDPSAVADSVPWAAKVLPATAIAIATATVPDTGDGEKPCERIRAWSIIRLEIEPSWSSKRHFSTVTDVDEAIADLADHLYVDAHDQSSAATLPLLIGTFDIDGGHSVVLWCTGEYRAVFVAFPVAGRDALRDFYAIFARHVGAEAWRVSALG